MADRPSMLKNLGILTVAQAATMLLNIVALVYIARTVGAHWFGVIQLGVAFLAYVLIIAEWGMGTLGVREVARLTDRKAIYTYACEHLGLMAVMALVVLAVGLVTLPLFPFFTTDAWVFLIYLVVIIPHFATLDWIGIGMERMAWVGFARASRSGIYATLVLVLLVPLNGVGGWPGYRWVPLIFLVAYCVSMLIMASGVKHWLGRWVRPHHAGRREWRRRLAATGPIGAGFLTMRVLLNVDVLMLGILAIPAVVGSYAAAAKIIFVLLIAVEVMWRALLPRLSRLWRESPALFRNRYNLYLGGALAVFLPVAVGGWLLGERLMHLLYADAYPGAGPVFQVLSISYALLAVGQFCGNGLIACDRQRAYFPPLLVSAALALLATWWFIPRQGGLGASYGMLAAHACLLGMTGWKSRSLLDRQLMVPLALAAAGGLVMAGFLLLCRGWPLLPLGSAAGVLYLAVTLPGLRRWSRYQINNCH